jgi:putative transposase
VIVEYVDAHREGFGVDPICSVLTEHGMAIAPSTYYAAKARGPVSDTAWDEAHAANTVHRLYLANHRLYGVRKMWHAMKHAGHGMGRDQVGRLMRISGISGATRGKRRTITTAADPGAPRHPDLLERKWGTPQRPDQWWVADFTYAWTLQGFVYTAFCVDVFSRRILGWRVMSTKATPLVTSVLEQAVFTRRRSDFRFTTTGLVHHSDAGSQGGFNLSSQHRVLILSVVGRQSVSSSTSGMGRISLVSARAIVVVSLSAGVPAADVAANQGAALGWREQRPR